MTEELIGGDSLYNEDYREAQQKLRARSEEAARAADVARFEGEEVRVLIVDDQDLVRNGFKLILSSYDFIKVVGEADNGLAAYDQARALQPDVVRWKMVSTQRAKSWPTQAWKTRACWC